MTRTVRYFRIIRVLSAVYGGSCGLFRRDRGDISNRFGETHRVNDGAGDDERRMRGERMNIPGFFPGGEREDRVPVERGMSGSDHQRQPVLRALRQFIRFVPGQSGIGQDGADDGIGLSGHRQCSLAQR